MEPEMIKKLAHVLVHYSLEVKEGEHLLIDSTSYNSHPLVIEVLKAALKVGAFPDVHIEPPEIRDLIILHGNEAQLAYVSPMTKFTVDHYNAILVIKAGTEDTSKKRTDPRKVKAYAASPERREIRKKFTARMGDGSIKYCGTLFPNAADAKNAGMSLEEYTEFLFQTQMLTSENPALQWQRMFKQQEELCKILNKKNELHIVSNNTDLRMNIKGSTWINSAGKLNFPDGEIFTSPQRESIEGSAHIDFPITYLGHTIKGIDLTFKNGKVTDATAEEGTEHLHDMLNIDEGARYIGEVGIGTNFAINRFTNNISFDEKMGGTLHIALGSSPVLSTGGKNESSIHKDLLIDMRKDSRIFADVDLIYENGEFQFKEE